MHRGKIMKKEKKEEVKPAGELASVTESSAGSPKIARNYTRQIMLILSGGLVVGGVALFAVYFSTQNIIFGISAFAVGAGGVFLFKYYWGKTDIDIIETLGGVTQGQVNSLCLYPGKLVFENVDEPGGFPQQCINDKKKYYVMIWDEVANLLTPFVLPDQQYYDPGVFAERVLDLPAHQKIFERKPSLLQKIRTGLLVVAIGIVWILILTTTGEG